MKGHSLPGPNQRKSPAKWKAPDEIFPGAPPEFAISLGWGGRTGATDAQGNPTGGGGFTPPGLSGGTWKYLGNEAYKGVSKGIRGFGEDIADFGKSMFKGGVKKFFKK